MVIGLKAKIKLNKNFYLIIFFIIFCLLLWTQYHYSRKNIINTFKNRQIAQTFLIKNKFKTIFDNAELVFKSKLEENIKKINTLYLLYDNLKTFNPSNAVSILNKNEKKGHYEVFIIDKHYKIIKTSYKPDLGYNLGKFPVFRKILNNVFTGKEQIDISPIYIDPASMNLKRYFLILSPDKKYLLQVAYVIDIYPLLRKTYFDIKSKCEDLQKLKLYFVSKYLIYPIYFNQRILNKTPLDILMKQSKKIFETIIKKAKIKTKPTKFSIDKNTAKEVFDIFQKKSLISFLDLNKHTFEIYTIINGFFKNFSNKLIIDNVYSTKILEKDLQNLKNRYLFILFFIVLIILLVKLIIYYISYKLNELVAHMKNNKEIKRDDAFIKEIDDLISTYNHYRNRLNEEVEKNKKILQQNRKFIIDTVHQIKTPLSIITLNSDFIKMKLNSNDEEIKEALDEIDAAISMLTTSYEDLSYLSSENIVEYKPSNINISDIINQRIKFFHNLAKAKNKKIVSNIKKDIYYKINKVEIERIIDNNIANAIEYSTEKDILVELTKEKEIVLKVISKGEKIKSPDKIFEKNYREHSHKRGLGMGLSIVKKICEKYGIKYKAYHDNGYNIFEYIFKI